MNNFLSFYKKHFILNDARFFKIEHEDALVATVYKVSLLNDKQYILKICTCPGDYLCEMYF